MLCPFYITAVSARYEVQLFLCFSIPCSLFPVPCSLKPKVLYLITRENAVYLVYLRFSVILGQNFNPSLSNCHSMLKLC